MKVEGRVIMEEEKVKNRWKEYFKELLSVKNEIEERSEEVVSGPITEITMEEVNKTVNNLKCGKAGGTTEVTAELFKCLNYEGLKWVTVLLNKILKEEKIPQEWRKKKDSTYL